MLLLRISNYKEAHAASALSHIYITVILVCDKMKSKEFRNNSGEVQMFDGSLTM